MADRRKEALKELAIAIAESTVDAWLAGDIADGQHNNIDNGSNHETNETPQEPTHEAKAEGLRKVRRQKR